MKSAITLQNQLEGERRPQNKRCGVSLKEGGTSPASKRGDATGPVHDNQLPDAESKKTKVTRQLNRGRHHHYRHHHHHHRRSHCRHSRLDGECYPCCCHQYHHHHPHRGVKNAWVNDERRDGTGCGGNGGGAEGSITIKRRGGKREQKGKSKEARIESQRRRKRQ